MSTILEAGLRDDLTQAHRGVIDAVATAGAWWTAAQRSAIAAEVRVALDHAEWPAWQAPSTVDGLIDPDHPLPASAVDAVWRITNHPGTLTRGWFDGIVAGLPSADHYAELVAIVAMVNSIDRLAHYLGLDPVPLVSPAAGEPSQTSPATAEVSSHWVPTTGKGPMVLRALSCVPADAAVQRRLTEAQYVTADALLGDLNWDRGTLDRRQIELVAAHTSMVNECFY